MIGTLSKETEVKQTERELYNMVLVIVKHKFDFDTRVTHLVMSCVGVSSALVKCQALIAIFFSLHHPLNLE